MKKSEVNKEVSQFLDEQTHPLRKEIEQLRLLILNSHADLIENIKWNGPNYSYNTEDRITLKIQPPKQLQVILHRGAKKLEQPKNKIIDDSSSLLAWKENDRAVITFKNSTDIEKNKQAFSDIIKKWINATKG